MSADSRPAADRTLRLAAIVLILLAGVMTGAQLGKIAPLVPWYVDGNGMSLVAAGWLAAILGLFIAATALPAGWVIARIGLGCAILVGSVATVVGGLALAVSHAPSAAFAARLVEAVGYLGLCVALPAALDAISPTHWKGPVLAVWSGFVPMGFAVSDFLAAAMLPAFAPPAFLLATTLLFAACAGAALLLLRGLRLAPPGARAGGGLASTLVGPVLLLAAAFGAFVVLSVSMFTFMPAFVAEAGAHYLASAGAIALSVPLGNVLAGVLVKGRGPGFMARLAVFGFAVGVAVAVPAFTLRDPVLATASAFALAVSGALVASAQFAAIPFVIPAAGAVPVAIGLVAQAGGIGTVFGPPVAAAVIERWGWTGFGWFLAGVGAVGLACMLPLTAAERPRSR